MDDLFNEKIFASDEEETKYYVRMMELCLAAGANVILPTAQGIIEIKPAE